MSSAQFVLLSFGGFVTVAVVSFFLLWYGWKLREAADKSSDQAAVSRSRVISNLILAAVLAAPLAYIFSSMPLSFGHKWQDAMWHWLVGLVAVVAMLALGGAYWRSKLLANAPVTVSSVANTFSKQMLLALVIVILPLVLEHHGVGPWGRFGVLFLILTVFEFASLSRRKIVWPEPPRQDGARA
ncbi:MAG: hypothetical protein RL291_1956 [Pseudomonadota bacterium]|jgi:cation transport ATPase